MTPTVGTKTVASELLHEIERVTAKRERWKVYERETGLAGGMGFGMALMTVALTRAKLALLDQDGVACIELLEELRGFDSDD